MSGDGKERVRLEEKVRKNKLQNKIIFLGEISAVPDFLNKIDIFVLPSKWEGFGIVLLEAGAGKLPVIASNVDGIKEIVCDKRNGLLFESANAQDLASKIKELINSKNKRKNLSEQLYRDVRLKFNIERMVRKYEQIYLNRSKK